MTMPSLILTDNKNQGGSKTMDEKYMKIKKIVIPTITMAIIASQLLGCNAVSQSELLQMINNGDMIEIEVAVPINQEQGEEQSILWEQLALLATNPDLRKSWDNTLNITSSTDGKNGVLYVNTNGDNEPNNTLRVALHNREFVKFLEDNSTLSELAEAVEKNYVDIETEDDMESVCIGINGYFNLLPDSSPNYANPESTLQRNEFMAMVYRAETPVQDLKEDSAFTTAVGKSDYNIYAQGVADDSYLDLASKSLNNMTYNGTISRAEAIYTIVNRYFADDYKNVDITSASATFTDAKDGGNIAEKQKFIENATAKDYWKSYELTYALQNPDQGLPTDLYKALVVAQNRGLITEDTRWDEGITKSEALQLLVEALKQETGIQIFTFKQGEIEGEALPLEEEPTQPDESTEEAKEIELLEHTVEPVEDYDIITPEEALARGISPYAGKTSKHGWVYPDDYVEYGPRYEDHISDTEMMFDMGLLDEAEYQELLKMYEEKNGTAATTTTPESTQSGTSAITSDAALDYILKQVPSHEPSTGNTGSTGNSNAAPIELPEGPTYEKTGRICY